MCGISERLENKRQTATGKGARDPEIVMNRVVLCFTSCRTLYQCRRVCKGTVHANQLETIAVFG